MLPSYVNLIFLSATTPNTLGTWHQVWTIADVNTLQPDSLWIARYLIAASSLKEFSDWIGRTKRKPVHVIKTNYRPVPLSHHLWAGSKLHKVLEGRGAFLDAGYRDATKALQPKDSAKKGTNKGQKSAAPAHRGGAKHLAWQAQGSKQNWMSLVRFLEREELTPTVVFSFSKKVNHRVEVCCMQVAPHKFSSTLTCSVNRNAKRLQTILDR